ncbi:porin [Flectobacillus sp. BAB-3569]|uniref:porin n=1 Tax=Flectobacillus sp. BAB-3569 TaxID=1509483 RepID=UPI000BA2F742|nr:porin [Flectobacillus sp. BAB-3569]PAC29512.1 hypothetical protein BWI92_15980 [Flectobacillus sp. BAB-3569]
MKKLLLICASVLLLLSKGLAQTNNSTITWSGYVDAYYAYDFNQPDDHLRPSFLYNHNRHNEFNINLAYIKGAYSSTRTRANLAIMAGTYAQYNMAAESPLLQHIFEANVGIKLSQKHDIWLDAGILPSHIGFESAVSKDCWTLTRSILAENSPYYESGAKLSYTSPNQQWTASVLALNGWQRIKRLDGNQTVSLGTQITHKPNENLTLNWSTYYGNEGINNINQKRYFSNLYAIYQHEKWGFIAGFDYGSQQKANTDGYNNWYSPVAIVRYQLAPKMRLAARYEYYQDKNGVIISTNTPEGFQVTGYSLNWDYQVAENAVFRIEAKNYHANSAIFTEKSQPKNDNLAITSSIAVQF